MTHSVGEYIEYLTGLGLSPKTIYVYRRAVERCLDSGCDLDTVTAVDLAAYAETLPTSSSTRRQFRSAVTRYWETIGRRNGPVGAIRVPPKPRGRCRALNPDVAARLVATAQGWHPEGLAVMFGLYMGLRREEIAKARWDRFDRGLEWYTVQGKLGVTATLPVHPALRAELEPTGFVWLFPGSAGRTYVSPATIWTWIQTVADKAGVGHVTPHQLRHTAIATANDQTGDLRAASTFARHASVDTTMLYTRTTTERLRDVTEAISYGDGRLRLVT